MIPYTSIDIPIKVPNEDHLYNYCITNTFSKNPKIENGIICLVGCREMLDDWRTTMDADGRCMDDEEITKSQYNRLYNIVNESSNTGTIYFEPRFKEQFPELVEACLKLPFKYFTGIFLLLAGKGGSLLHKDPPVLLDGPTQQTLNRYNISLNCFDNPKFFVIDGSEKIYIKVTKEYPCFAFNGENYLHGADQSDVDSQRRMQLIIHGMLDANKHQELINRSITKCNSK
jgi:hypothetical protein